MIINNKQQMRAMYLEDLFGNRFQTFDIHAVLDGYHPPVDVCLWYNDKPGATFPNYTTRICDWNLLVETIKLWVTLGCDLNRITVSEDPGTNQRLFQGEVQRNERFLDLFWTTTRLPMRQALQQDGHTATGICAQRLLEHFLDTPSLDNLYRLLDTYDGHVVEFTTFERSLGLLQLNTIFWEVRHY